MTETPSPEPETPTPAPTELPPSEPPSEPPLSETESPSPSDSPTPTPTVTETVTETPAPVEACGLDSNSACFVRPSDSALDPLFVGLALCLLLLAAVLVAQLRRPS